MIDGQATVKTFRRSDNRVWLLRQSVVRPTLDADALSVTRWSTGHFGHIVTGGMFSRVSGRSSGWQHVRQLRVLERQERGNYRCLATSALTADRPM